MAIHQVTDPNVDKLISVYRYYLNNKGYHEWVENRHTNREIMNESSLSNEYWVHLDICDWIQDNKVVWDFIIKHGTQFGFLKEMMEAYIEERSEDRIDHLLNNL